MPFTARLALVGGTLVLALIFYMISFVTIRNGNIITIPVGLAAWVFKKRGLFITTVIGFCILVMYHYIRLHTLLWPLAFVFPFFGNFLLLLVIGSIVVTLRGVLDITDDARLKAQEAERQTALAYEQQRHLNELKNQFILNVNHELRSPLTVISGYLSLLIDKHDRFDKAAQMNFLKNALRSCNELQTLTNDVLDTITLSKHKGQLPIENIAIAVAAREAVEHINTLWDQPRQARFDIPDNVVARANLPCLRQVLRNLLSNAYKYSPENAPVTISATTSGETGEASSEVCISIKDAGPGIPPDQIPLLFGQFVRLPRDLAGSVRGSGLGLYICKSLIEAMGGRIWVESSGVAGEGSCFCFTLPCAIPITTLS
ncbi:MAG TPA: HAMP domain-containing sensor histidine kinase [Ktedonobacteraceae bacterium]|nr:HAMP domain-containing sensor histidine kinase [Ktedonobacteraceae bacterium]